VYLIRWYFNCPKHIDRIQNKRVTFPRHVVVVVVVVAAAAAAAAAAAVLALVEM
jgi:hypothetical protein